MVYQSCTNKEFTGITLDLGTVKRARAFKINISGTCNVALQKEIAKREREGRKG
jgi:post-segregation antitoxin (ccd killing protein)